jgi:hypothetical protein
MEESTLFTTRVQPILMNACVTCHATDKGGSFHLTNTFDDGALNRKATQENLAAALAQINRANWQASPLLVKAATIHGPMSQPALKGRQIPAFHTLEEWVQRVVANMPESVATVSVAAAVEPARSEREPRMESPAHTEEKQKPVRKPTTAGPFAATPEKKTDAETRDPAIREVPHAASTTPPPAPPPAEPADPFDPILFNRAEHPEVPAPAPVEQKP